MADVRKTIEILFKGSDEVSGVLDTVSGGVSGFGQGLEDIVSPLAGVTDDILKLDAALATLAVGGLVYAFIKSTELESAIVDLEKVMGEGEKFTDDLSDAVTDLSRLYGESSIGIINSLAGLRQSGLETTESFEVLETSMKLARASELEVESATNFLKRTLIGYNLEVDKAIEVGDLWNETSNVANTTVGKLAEGFAIVSRQASDAGFSLTETSAALTPIIGVFDSGSEAGIAFSMALTSMLNPTAEGEKAIRMLTGATGPLNQEFATGKDLFEAVAIGLQDVDKQTGAVAVAQIVGARQAKRVKVSFDDYFATLEKIGPASKQYNSLQREVDVQNATSQASVDRLKAGFEELFATMGTQFRAAATDAVVGATEIEHALTDLIKDETFKPIFEAVASFSKEIGEYLSGIAKAMPAAFKDVEFGDLLDAFDEIKATVGELFEEVDLTDPKDLAKVIQFVIGSIETLVKVTEGIIGPLGKFAKGIISLIQELNNLDDETKLTMGSTLGWAKVIDSVLGPLGSLLKAVEALAYGLNVLIGVKVVSALGGWGTALAGINLAGVTSSLTSLIALLGKTGLVGAAGAAGFAVGTLANHLIEEYFPSVNDAIQKTIEFADRLFGISDIPSKIDMEIEADLAFEKAKQMAVELRALSEKPVEVTIAEPTFPGGISAEEWLAQLEMEEALADITIGVDDTSVREVEQKFKELTYIVDGETRYVQVAVDQESVDDTTEALEEIPDEKKFEVDIEVEKIKAQAEIVQSSLEWTAKVNIAEIEAQAKVIESMYEGISVGIESTGDVISSAFDKFGDVNLSILEKWDLQKQIEIENELRTKAFEDQQRLNAAQIAYMEAKTEAMEAGEGLISIRADGLEPELEAFMWKILEKIQIRANEESAEFLLGV